MFLPCTAVIFNFREKCTLSLNFVSCAFYPINFKTQQITPQSSQSAHEGHSTKLLLSWLTVNLTLTLCPTSAKNKNKNKKDMVAAESDSKRHPTQPKFRPKIHSQTKTEPLISNQNAAPTVNSNWRHSNGGWGLFTMLTDQWGLFEISVSAT